MQYIGVKLPSIDGENECTRTADKVIAGGQEMTQSLLPCLCMLPVRS